MANATAPAMVSDQLRDVLGVWGRSQQKIVSLAAEFADSVEWVLDGSPSPAHWIAGVADIEVSTAREWIRIGRKLQGLPEIAAAFSEGRVSYSKVRTLTRYATAENEHELLDIAVGVPAGELRRAMAKWLQRKLTPEELDAYHQSRRSIRWQTEHDGMMLYILRCPPLLGERFRTVLQGLAADHPPEIDRRNNSGAHDSLGASAGGWPSFAQQYSDAFGRLLDEGGGDLSTEVIIHVRGDGCSLDDGTPIPETVVADIADESFIRALIHDAQSRPINASGRQRHPTSRQKRVVKESSKVCVDCGATDRLEYDHVPAFVQSGRTAVEELEIRCFACHRRRHEEG